MFSEQKQIDEIVNYIKSGEKPKNDHKLGVEIEHFVVHKDSLEAVSYYGTDGIQDILREMLKLGWEPVYENGYLMAVVKNGTVVNLEPGGQLEVSIPPELSIKNIEKHYLDFAKDIIPITERKNITLINLGYQPVTCIKDIKMIPKKRYEYMYEYFKNTGKYAHNMMKATASIQVSIDYENENDYIMKNKVAYFLSPLVYYIFDNVPFFEGKVCNNMAMRYIIWNNCDNDRCKSPEDIFSEDYGYLSYARYLLNVRPIIIKKGSDLIFTGDKSIKDIFIYENFSEEELDYIFTMVFPDVRTKKYIEIRMGDSLPYPYNMGYVALWKGIMYNKDNLILMDNIIKKHGTIIMILLKAILDNIYNKEDNEIVDFLYDIWSFFGKITEMAKRGLPDEEKHYLAIFEKMLNKTQTPREKILKNLHKGKHEVLKESILDEVIGKDMEYAFKKTI